MPASVTVINGTQSTAAVRDRRRCPARGAWSVGRAQRRTRRLDLGLPARRRLELHAGARRWHPDQQLRRCVRLRAPVGRQRRSRRDRPRTAERAVRVGSDWRGRSGHHETRRRRAPRRRASKRATRPPFAPPWAPPAPRVCGRGASARSASRATGSRAQRRRVKRSATTTTSDRSSGTFSYQRPQGLDVTVAGQFGQDERGFPGPWGGTPIGAFTGCFTESRDARMTRAGFWRARHAPMVRVVQTACREGELTYSPVERFHSLVRPVVERDLTIGRPGAQEDIILSLCLTTSGEVSSSVKEQGRSTNCRPPRRGERQSQKNAKTWPVR